MKQNILIATATKPSVSIDIFFDTIAKAALTDFDLVVTRGLLTTGPGCNNLALRVHGKQKMIDEFGKQLCMALMPAKWGGTNDEIPEGFNCEIEL